MKNKKKLVTYLGEIGLFLILVGVSYATFVVNFVGDKNQEIVIGEDFIFSYNETSNGLSLTDSDILSDENGKVSEKYFDFNVKLQTQNSKTVDYYIYLTKDTTSTLDDSYVKLYLTDQNDTALNDVTPINELEEHETYTNSYYYFGNSITSNNNIETVHNYRLRVWVSDTYDTSYKTEENGNGIHISQTSEETYKFTINVATGKIPINLANNWKDKTENEKSYLALYTIDTKDLPETYSYNEEVYTLTTTIDVSEQENGNVILGEYTSGSNMIAVMGQDKGVVAPENSMNLFGSLSKVTIIDLSKLDTSNVTNMSGMFSSCISLTSLDLSNFDTFNVTNMFGMFHGSGLTSLDVSNFDTSNVTNMEAMFRDSGLISLDLSNFDTRNVTTMEGMFYECNSLTEVTVGCNWTTANASTSNMFYNAGTSSVTKVCNE